MARCPLCEHEQPAAAACEVCGRSLGPAPAISGAAPPLEGLERTCSPPAVAPPAPPFPELERHAVASVDPGPAGPSESWVEATAHAAAGEVAVEALAVDRTAAAAATRTPPADLEHCRYCGELVPTGEPFCLRCAMRTAWRAPAAAPPAEVPVVRCPSCGTRCAGERCLGCGARLPLPGEG